MEDKKTSSMDAGKSGTLGMFINGLFLGAGSRVFQSQTTGSRIFYSCSVALPGLSGAVSLGIGPNACDYLNKKYTLGQEIHFRIEPPRASGGRIYFSALECDGVDCSA